jgi:hypothetical protein
MIVGSSSEGDRKREKLVRCREAIAQDSIRVWELTVLKIPAFLVKTMRF